MSRILLAILTTVAAMAQSKPAVVVELFTSEGCSSCPPADLLLQRLSANRDIEVIPLSEHVDYWNHLGWKDPFSSALFSARQQDYGRMFRLESVYTPQMVVNGEVQFLGSDRVRAEQEIRRAAQSPRARVEIFRLSADTIRLKADGFPQDTRKADVFLAVTDLSLASDVRDGENAGRHLAHTGVVRSISRVGQVTPKDNAGFSADTKVNLRPEWQTPNLKLVVFVQDRSTRKIIGAATLRLS